MKKATFFSTISTQLSTHTVLGANLRRAYEIHNRLLAQQSLSVVGSCLLEAENHFKGKNVSVALARDYLEDAVAIADVLLDTDILATDEKKLLAKVYGEYADFLKQTTSSTHYPIVRKYIDKSLALDPENQLAKESDSDLSYNFKI